MEVLRYVINLEKKDQDVFVRPFTDLHIGHPGHVADMLNKSISLVKEDSRYYGIGLGDYVENNTWLGRGQKTFDPEQLIHTGKAGLLSDQKRKVKQLFEPISKKMIGLHLGNHEDRTMLGSDFKAEICDPLGVNYLGHKAFIILSFFYKGRGISEYKLLTQHSRFGGQKGGTVLNAAENAYNLYHDFDFILFGHCLSEDTEILTDSGWKTHEMLTDQDKVMTMNPATSMLEWNNLQAIWKYTNFDKHVNMQHRSFDLSLTPDHTVYYYATRDGPLLHNTAEYVSKLTNIHIPQCGELEYKGVNLTDDELSLLGWFVAEGSFLKTKNNKTYAVRLWQNWKNKHLIIDILDRLGYEYSLYRKPLQGRVFVMDGKSYTTSDDEAAIYIPAKYSELAILKHLTSKVLSEELASNMSKSQFLIYLKALVAGDGWCMAKDSKYPILTVTTANKNLADQLQTMGVTRGIKTRIDEVKRGYDVRFTFSSALANYNGDGTTPYIPYKGVSWCVTVPNGTIMVRRRGMVVITGNTHMTLVHKIERDTVDLIAEKPHRITKKTYIVNCGCMVENAIEGFDNYTDKRMGGGSRNPSTVTLRFAPYTGQFYVFE